jgi:penicillin-binding protein 1A
VAKQTRQNPQPKTKKKRRFTLKIPRLLKLLVLLVLLAGVIGGGGLFGYAVATIPPYDPAKLGDVDATSKIYDINGELIANLHAEENRTPVALEQIPLHLRNAVLAMEDNQFYSHYGIDVKGWVRAIRNMLAGGKKQGGSTITNQLAQMAFLTPDRTITVKIQELIVTFRLERDYSKDEILEFYLNRLFLGASAYGVQAAAQYYFDKDVQDLNLAESAIIAGLIPAPNAYSPYVNMERAKARQAETLNNMERFGYITPEEKQQALDYEIVLGSRKSGAGKKSSQYFVSYVREQVINVLEQQGHSRAEASQMLYTGGLEIKTTLDVRLQDAAERALNDGLEQWLIPLLDDKEERNAKGILQPQSAVILLDTKTGGIRAMIGGREYENDQYNRAVQLIKQQPGSAIKPITVYGPALERKATASTIIMDEPLYENGEDNPPYPVNYDGKTRGPVTLRYAWQQSLNIPAWQVAKENGIDKMLEFAQRLGISTLVDQPINGMSDRNLAALAIGGVTKGVIPLEMARAYSAIGNHGVLNETHAVTEIRNDRGQVIYQHRPQSKVVLSEEVAYMMTDIMQDVVDYGTASYVRSLGGYYGPVAGKTGTTNYNREAWFVGYTPELTGAVFIGHDDNTTGRIAGDKANPSARGRLPGGSSSYISAGIFGKLMKNVSAIAPGASQFYTAKPEGIVGPLAIDRTTGLLAGPDCPPDSIIYEEYIKGTEPQEVCNGHQPEPPLEDLEPGDQIEGPEDPGDELGGDAEPGDEPDPGDGGGQ